MPAPLVLRTVYLEAEVDDQLRIMAYNLNVPKNELINFFVALGMAVDCGDAAVEEKLREKLVNWHAVAESNRFFKANPPATEPHFVSAQCEGEKCAMCKKAATHKVGEEIFDDDPDQNRHNFTAYVCCKHFRKIMGDAVSCK